VKEAFAKGAIRSFARHSRLGYTDRNGYEEVRADFMEAVAYLRKLGYKRITLKTGSYGNEALAMSIKFATDAKLDLLTIDGSGGGTGMSPWNMMESWGVPSINLHSKAYEYASILKAKGQDVVDLAFAGGLAREDHIFKALALGAPFTKLVCMGRALMIPGFLGANIEGALYPDRKAALNGNWDALPKHIKDEAGASPEEIFAGYFEVKEKLGADAMKQIPLGAIAVWTLSDKLKAGLQQLMAGARRFNVAGLSRDDLFAANRETERETGIKYLADVNDAVAKEILNLK
jgi:glutamate synthase domain-containing protein 2